MSLDLSKIGQLLKETREAKGLKLEDVSAALYLRKSMVDALESGDWQRLPHQVYVKGYLNQYASFLGVEDALADVVQSYRESTEPPDSLAQKAKDNPREENYAADKISRIYPKRRFVIYGLGVAILVFFLAYQNMNIPHSPAPARTYVVSNAAYEGAGKSSERPNASLLEPKKLMIACQERTWVRIVIDEAEKKEFMLNPEEMVAFNAREGFDLLIGNAGGVTLFYNGKNIGFQGEIGEVKRVRLP